MATQDMTSTHWRSSGRVDFLRHVAHGGKFGAWLLGLVRTVLLHESPVNVPRQDGGSYDITMNRYL